MHFASIVDKKLTVMTSRTHCCANLFMNLVGYDSNEDEIIESTKKIGEKNDQAEKKSLKRKFDEIQQEVVEEKGNDNNQINFFASTLENSIQLKIRNFPHVEGNWPTFIFIPIEQNEVATEEFNWVLNEYFNVLKNKIDQAIKVHCMQDLHCSLSRTFVLREHQIETFVGELRRKIKPLFESNQSQDLRCTFDKLKWFSNDEKNRNFLSLVATSSEASSPTKFIRNLISAVDAILNEFRKPLYYKQPEPHVSIGWTSGNAIYESIEKKDSNLLAFDLKKTVRIRLSSIVCICGNRYFKIAP